MIRTGAGLAVLLVAILSLSASPAQAADELELSSDGQSWSGQLPGPLFDPALRWVPGDDRHAEFYVRNQADDGGTVTIAVDSPDQDQSVLVRDIRLSARIGSESWVDLAPMGEAFRLNAAALPADAVRKLTVRARFDPASGNRSQQSAVALSYTVTLSDAASTSDPDDEAADGTDQPTDSDAAQNLNGAADLPNTGAPAVGWLLVAAGVAVGVGLALMKRRRREDSAHEISH